MAGLEIGFGQLDEMNGRGVRWSLSVRAAAGPWESCLGPTRSMEGLIGPPPLAERSS